jgi:beta-lactamase regulating signal transducer with metallopeptidase domain/HEAT repeat protein
MIQSFLAGLFTLPASNISTLMMLLKATLILVTALAVTVTMRRASAGARHLVWLVTLGTLLLVPALTAWSPLRLAILPPAKTVASKSAPSVTPSATPTAINETPVINETSASLTQDQKTAPVSRGIFARIGELSGFATLLTIWAAIVIALAGWLAYGALSVRRIVRRAKPLDTPDWLTPLYEVADRLEIDEAPRLLRSEDAKMPFACGVLHPTIVFPADCDNWTQDRRHAVLLHELAHVRRHDLIGHTLGRLACAVYWFHPLVWTAAKQLRSESERACDDLALSCGARPSDYAEHLLDIVTSVRHDATPAVALAMARRKEFEGRMLAILDPELRHSSPSRWQSAGLIASLAVVAIVVGAAAPAQRAVPIVKASIVPETTHRSDIALAPAPKIQQPTTSKLEQNPPAPEKSQPAWPNSGTPGESATKTSLFQRIVQNTVQSTTNVVSKAISDAASDKSLEKAVDNGVEKAATALADKTSSRILTLLAEKGVKVQGRDDRPVLLANILRTDADPNLRRIAAWGLAEYSESAVGTDALVYALRRDASASVREMAAWALGEGGDGNSAALDALIAAFRSDSDPKVRQTAIWALGEIGDNSAADAIAAGLTDASPSIRMRAIWALGQIEPKSAPKALVAMLRDPNPQIREMTAWALFQIEDPSVVDELDAALRSETDKNLQMAYIKALAATGEKSVEGVRRLLDSKDPQVRSMAVRALAGGRGAGPWPWPWPQPRPQP